MEREPDTGNRFWERITREREYERSRDAAGNQPGRMTMATRLKRTVFSDGCCENIRELANGMAKMANLLERMNPIIELTIDQSDLLDELHHDAQRLAGVTKSILGLN